ncbi:MAG: hypothetical protein ACLTD3_05695, partial [Blautia sp.]
TVTCRQFPNLTFAPRKTRHFLAATSRFIAIMSQQGLLYTRHFTYASPFFIYFCIFISTILFILFYPGIIVPVISKAASGVSPEPLSALLLIYKK